MDAKYLDGIRSGDTVILREIYRNYYPSIQRLIRTNNGSDEDAQDIFQEAIIIVFNKLQKGDMRLSSSFKTFLYAICRNLWMNALKKRSRRQTALDNEPADNDVSDEIIDEIEKRDRIRLYQKHFANMGEQCQKILRLYLEGHSMRQIAAEIGTESEEYVKTKKYKCKKALIDAIKQDIEFRELVSEHGR